MPKKSRSPLFKRLYLSHTKYLYLLSELEIKCKLNVMRFREREIYMFCYVQLAVLWHIYMLHASYAFAIINIYQGKTRNSYCDSATGTRCTYYNIIVGLRFRMRNLLYIFCQIVVNYKRCCAATFVHTPNIKQKYLLYRIAYICKLMIKGFA